MDRTFELEIFQNMARASRIKKILMMSKAPKDMDKMDDEELREYHKEVYSAYHNKEGLR